ncbi:kinase-like domain-containing protein [Glomus cerebriforme]|uniref:Kinase-like domain-containing protein n=1 Tax=Glomus cerebriforme TaxID=658196 RepID=A0A397SUF5_9GLOM|nr:kinase-like domain-containing protein [Glomus cerebriforme]
MSSLSHKPYEKCKECNQEITPGNNWCNSCNAKYFQLNFETWTSGNDDIDKFIQDIQSSAKYNDKVLEWIPYNRFYNIEFIAKGGFGEMYKAKLIDGYLFKMDNKNQNWKRDDQSMFVALKSLNNSKNITLEFINEITLHKIIEYDSILPIIKIYGITQDPITKNYMIVLDYAENGSLRNYLDKSYHKLSWDAKLSNLYYIATGLKEIHKKELIHRNLHSGNILKSEVKIFITDIGLCKPADYNTLDHVKNSIYGVLPYMAPEILRGQNYTKAADIYSFGIIMYEIISGLPPYHDISHDKNLAMEICQGLRPRFNFEVPRMIIHLIKRCLDANPLNRPTANEIKKILSIWVVELELEFVELVEFEETELKKQIIEADKFNNNLQINNLPSNCLSYMTHSEAIYTSRLFNFNNLPEPKNTDDYYEEFDNIISMEYFGNQYNSCFYTNEYLN